MSIFFSADIVSNKFQAKCQNPHLSPSNVLHAQKNQLINWVKGKKLKFFHTQRFQSLNLCTDEISVCERKSIVLINSNTGEMLYD